jgi:aspartate-semialdehyde dehydrogenase
MKIALVGATGLVGGVMLKVLEERNFSNITLLPVASDRSVNKQIKFFNKKINIISIREAIQQKPDIAIFSAGSKVSLEFAPLFAEQGCYVIDNSSAWRMYQNIPLVVPEINASVLKAENRIIANPNCSTIQLVLALSKLHEKYKIKRMVVSTYQSVSGTGVLAVKQLENERKGIETEMAYPHPIHKNLFPHGGSFQEDGYTTEEQKLVDETRKILSDNSIKVSATVVRVPVTGGHSIAANVEFVNTIKLDDVRTIIANTSGVIVQDDVINNIYPMPKYAEGKDEVFVGRIRMDDTMPNTINLWIVADNLRKGAATNAVQIAQYLIEKKFVK